MLLVKSCRAVNAIRFFKRPPTLTVSGDMVVNCLNQVANAKKALSYLDAKSNSK